MCNSATPVWTYFPFGFTFRSVDTSKTYINKYYFSSVVAIVERQTMEPENGVTLIEVMIGCYYSTV